MYISNLLVYIVGIKRRAIVKGNSAAEFVSNKPNDESLLGVRLLSKTISYYNSGNGTDYIKFIMIAYNAFYSCY